MFRIKKLIKNIFIVTLAIIIGLLSSNKELRQNFFNNSIVKFIYSSFESKNNQLLETTFTYENELEHAFKSIQKGEVFLGSRDELGRESGTIIFATTSNLPTEKRGSIKGVKPSGWNQKRYDDLIEDKYLFNRCHLLGYQYSSLNAEPLNLITCTRQANLEMIPFENLITDTIKSGIAVKVMVKPVFLDHNLLASFIEIYAETETGEILVKTIIKNEQKGIKINYLNGESERE